MSQNKFTNVFNVMRQIPFIVVFMLMILIPNFGNAQYANLSAYCYPNVSGNVPINTNVVWNTTVYGGNGVYTFSWNGNENLASYTQAASKMYTSLGYKSASVSVSSNGQTITINCGTINIIQPQNYYVNNSTSVSYPSPFPSNYVYPSQYQQPAQNQNQVLSYTNTPNVSQVYLNNVPATGIFDDVGAMMFLYSVVFFSLWVTFLIVKRKYKTA